ncbi:MAG: GldG family protein [Verrucomicrobia bacterium]|nr:GldG family protein [Verrucomicrobiota bacterium]
MVSPDSFRTARWIRTLNLVLQAILFLTLFGGLNYLARNHSWRFDLTHQHRYSLSAETRAYISSLTQPSRVVVTLTPDSENLANVQAYRDISGLLREYTYASEGNPTGRITVEYLDVYKNRRKAEEYGIDSPDVVVVISGANRKALNVDDFYRVKDRQREAFIGEQTLTSALLEVTAQVRKKIYFLTGHGELNPEDVDPVRGLSSLKDQLRVRNFDVDRLDLAATRKVPADAALLIAVAPQVAYTAEEQELLRQYLGAGAGRLIALLAPGSPHGLASLLLDWGVLVDDDLVYDPGPGTMTEEGDLILRLFQPHPITQSLIDYVMPLRIGQARSVRPDPGRKLAGLTVTTLAVTSATAWGEVSYRLQRAPEYNPGYDIRNDRPGLEPPNHLGIVIASERVNVRAGLDFSVRGGRLVVFGTGDLIANNRIALPGNLDIFLNAVNWAVENQTQFNIPIRPIERFQLSLSASELSRLRSALLLALPGAALALGLIVYWTRRR